jgi:HK97 family phage portal protein
MAAGVPLAEVLDLHNSAITWNKNVAKNGGTPPMYAIADGIGEEEAAKLKQKYRDINGGANNAGDLNVVPGELKLQTLAVRPNDAEWEKAVSMCSRIILMALGVPSELMNDAANKTYNNQQEANKAFYTQTCIPIAQRIFTAISRDARAYYKDRPEIKIDKDKIEELQNNRDLASRVATRMHRFNIIDTNEAREMLDFAPRTDEINNQITGASEDVQDDIKSTKLRSVINGI